LKSEKLSLCLSDFGSILNGFGRLELNDGGNRRFGQVVGCNAESPAVSGVGDHDFLSYWVDIGV
jgi:hypothetical protein